MERGRKGKKKKRRGKLCGRRGRNVLKEFCVCGRGLVRYLGRQGKAGVAQRGGDGRVCACECPEITPICVMT